MNLEIQFARLLVKKLGYEWQAIKECYEIIIIQFPVENIFIFQGIKHEPLFMHNFVNIQDCA